VLEWIRYSPTFSLKSPIGVFTIEPSLASRGLGDGPPVSASRYSRARKLAEDTLAALDRKDLVPAADRLLALAAEFQFTERAAATEVSNRVSTLNEIAGKLSPEDQTQRASAIFDEIVALVTKFRTIADQAEHDAAELAPPVLESALRRPIAHGRPASASSAVVEDAELAAVCVGVSWSAGGKVILDDVSIDLRRGSVVGVVGHNGAGKTTLLRLLAQEIRPTPGEVSYPDLERRLYRFERLLDRIGYVPQISRRYSGGLETHLLAFAALRGLRDDALADEVAFAMERFGLGALKSAQWEELSGGFRTRVDLARATLTAPDLLILDEPLGPLDSPAQREYLRYVRDLADSWRESCVVVTSQDVNAIAEIADHIVVLKDGALLFAGAPDEIERALQRRSFELSGGFTAERLAEIFKDLPSLELQDRGTSHVVHTDTATTARDVLAPLLAADETLRYFRDLSRSPEQLLEIAKPGG
jgi:ABC-type multidrug transport system ATPase subunit